MGRYLDQVGSPDNPLQGLCLDDSLQPGLATSQMPVAAIDSPSSYSFYARGVWGAPESIMYEYFDALGQAGVATRDAAMTQSGRAALMSSTLRRQLLPFQPSSEEAAKTLPPGTR